MKLNVHYDKKIDVLYLSREGEEEEVEEIYPGINLELDKEGKIIGIEILNASTILKDALQPLQEKISQR
jgi:uncharacterized protein YuzE